MIEIGSIQYAFSDPLTAFQACFKLFKALQLDFTPMCANVWIFIEKLIYNIETSSQTTNAQVHTLLNEFKLYLRGESDQNGV